MKNPKPQRLVAYIHEDLNLWYVGCYDDGPNLHNSSSIESNYSRARQIHRKLLDGDTDNRSLQSGFMIALINTDFAGWKVYWTSDQFANAELAADEKSRVIQVTETAYPELVFVGAHSRHVKGVYGTGLTPTQWTRKWNITSMTQAKIREKIDFIVRSIDLYIAPKIYSDAYMATVCPHTHGPRMRNYGPYEIVDLATLFRYVRNYIGKDL